jgi:hypothetical protein
MALPSQALQIVSSPSTEQEDKNPSPMVHGEHGMGKIELAGQRVFCGHEVSLAGVAQ